MTIAAEDRSMRDGPAARADRLLLDVLGEEQYRRLRTVGYLDLPSRRHRGRVYRLDSLGNLSYRDAGETGFNTTLCVQPEEPIPRDDQIAMRYLLVTADEDRLLETANPITFGFISLARALYHDFAQRHPAWLAGAITFCIIGFFLGALGVEAWVLVDLLNHHPALSFIILLVCLVPALVGAVLLIAGAVELGRSLRTWSARRHL